jgi:hypothetical protein
VEGKKEGQPSKNRTTVASWVGHTTRSNLSNEGEKFMGNTIKSFAILLLFLCMALGGVWLWQIEQEVRSLADIVVQLRDRNVPRLTVTGKYPYIEVEKGAMVVVSEEEKK